jgi:hypothetical protein
LGAILLNLAFPLILVAALFLFFWIFIKRQRARKRYSPLTEDMLRTPAQRLESELDALTEKLSLGINAILLPAIFVYVGLRTSVLAWALVGLIALLGAWSLWKTLHKSLQLRLAIDGEQYTGLELNYLMRAGARVFHDIPYQYGNIDHVIVSTGGVFVVETKTYRKPAGMWKSSRQATVNFDGKELVFPHFRTVEPMEQARRHSKHVKARSRCLCTSAHFAIAVSHP